MAFGVPNIVYLRLIAKEIPLVAVQFSWGVVLATRREQPANIVIWPRLFGFHAGRVLACFDPQWPAWNFAVA